jgi:hypothetical protein
MSSGCDVIVIGGDSPGIGTNPERSGRRFKSCHTTE